MQEKKPVLQQQWQQSRPGSRPKSGQNKLKQQHILPQNNSSCKCHSSGGHFEPSCLKCIESARAESICLQCSKTWDYCLTFSCCYCRRVCNDGNTNTYKTNLCRSFLQEGFTSGGSFIFAVGHAGPALHLNSADTCCVFMYCQCGIKGL